MWNSVVFSTARWTVGEKVWFNNRMWLVLRAEYPKYVLGELNEEA